MKNNFQNIEIKKEFFDIREEFFPCEKEIFINPNNLSFSDVEEKTTKRNRFHYNKKHVKKLKAIFRDYYEQMLYILHPRKSVIENVNKMIDCGDSSQGGAFWGCPDCGELKFNVIVKNADDDKTELEITLKLTGDGTTEQFLMPNTVIIQ